MMVVPGTSGGLRIGLYLRSPGQDGTRHGFCSTKYVRGREASEARVIGQLEFDFIADCNSSFILQEVR